jgi:hypothetical protein
VPAGIGDRRWFVLNVNRMITPAPKPGGGNLFDRNAHLPQQRREQGVGRNTTWFGNGWGLAEEFPLCP